MRCRVRAVAIILTVGTLLPSIVLAQAPSPVPNPAPTPASTPAPANTQAGWILYERANAMIAQREYGQALQLYKEAISQAGIFPEAEVGVGDVYLEEGEFDLARTQYEKAYNLRKGFSIADSQYEVLYKLARLFETQEMYRLMEDDLLKIVGDDKRYSDPASEHLRAMVERNYLDKGIDHTLLLYQMSVPFASAAHSKLGWFYYRTGRFTQSISHLLYSVIYTSKEVEDYLKSQDVEWQYTSFADILVAIDSQKKLAEYIAGTDYFKDLYYLAGSSFADGYPTHAIQLWKLLAASKSSGRYGQLSTRQLKSPWTEKLLGVDRSGAGNP